MENIEDYLTPSVIAEIIEQIHQADGNEVVFVGNTNQEKIVNEVHVMCRGSQFSVPIVQEAAERSDVVIHNHPSGLIHPSENDIHNAHRLAQFGVASYIVNNEATEIYVIIEPFGKEGTLKLEIEKLCASLAPGGVVSQFLKDYEFRSQQIEMIRQVAVSFNEQKIGVIEAGTGVGKSLAYLIPAIFWSVINKERCVVSTRTINLQEQLIYKDIPFLKKILEVDFKAVLVKGRGNYLCLRKIDSLKQNQQMLVLDEDRHEIQIILEWAKTSQSGSKSELNFLPQNSTWEQVASESDTCLRHACPFYQDCFVYKARKQAAQANLLIANHHLLFSDFAVRASGVDISVLPKYSHIIFDEAHNLEDIATDYLGLNLSRYGINRLLSKLFVKRKDKTTGLLMILVNKLNFAYTQNKIAELKKIVHQIQEEIIPQIEAAFILNNELMDEIANQVFSFDDLTKYEIKVRLNERIITSPAWNTMVVPKINNFLPLISKIHSQLNASLSRLEDINIRLSRDILSLKIDIDAFRRRLGGVIDTIKKILLEQDLEHVRWIEVVRRNTGKDLISLKLAPLDISASMNSLVYANCKTIIMTSATLTIAGIKRQNDFHYFTNQIGLNLVSSDKIIKCKIPAPFDYEKQAITAIPNDIPSPDSPQFAESISELIFEALQISHGRAFILFTSYGLLNVLFNFLEPQLTKLGITALKQGQTNRHQLLQIFKEDKNSVLFATDSFWQGVDVEGEALESVIITKLPFKVPSEPIIEARVEAIEKRGGNAFLEYSVPQAVLKLKQGFGRLIRKKTDVGSIFILDKRIVEKFYGPIFLDSLPRSQMAIGGQTAILQKVREFFQTVK